MSNSGQQHFQQEIDALGHKLVLLKDSINFSSTKAKEEVKDEMLFKDQIGKTETEIKKADEVSTKIKAFFSSLLLIFVQLISNGWPSQPSTNILAKLGD